MMVEGGTGEGEPGRAEREGGELRAMLKHAAVARASILLSRGLDPSDPSYTPSPKHRRRRSQVRPGSPLHAQRQRATSGGEVADDAPIRQLAESFADSQPNQARRAHAETILPAPSSASRETVPQRTQLETAETAAAEQPTTIAAQDQSAAVARDDAGLRAQLLAAQAEVLQLQHALRAEQEACRELTAQLRDAHFTADQLRDNVTRLETQLAESKQAAGRSGGPLEPPAAGRNQHPAAQAGSEVSDARLQELVEDVAAIQKRLKVSEDSNERLQVQWEEAQQEHAAEIAELMRVCAAAEEAKKDAEEERDNTEAERHLLLKELEDVDDQLQEANKKLNSQEGLLRELETLQRELDAATGKGAASGDISAFDAGTRPTVDKTRDSQSGRVSSRARPSMTHAPSGEREEGTEEGDAARRDSERQSMSEGIQIGGVGLVSEGVQTMAVGSSLSVSSTAAQTRPAAGTGIHTQTLRSESRASAAQTVGPETSTTATATMVPATATTATGTGDEAETEGGMDTVEVAPGPAPAPRELMESDSSSVATSLDAHGPGGSEQV